MKTTRQIRNLLGAIAGLALFFAATPAKAQVTVVRTAAISYVNSTKNGFATAHLGTTARTFDTTGVGKLVVVISGEPGNNNQVLTFTGVSFNGSAMTKAVNDNTRVTSSNDCGDVAIYYMDNPAVLTAGTFSFTASSTSGAINGGVVTILGLAGTKTGAGITAKNSYTSPTAASTPSTSITTSGNTSLIIAAVQNSGANNGVTGPTATSPLTQIHSGTWGSAWGGLASGRQSVTSSGTTITPTFSTVAGGNIHVIAAEFKEGTPPTLASAAIVDDKSGGPVEKNTLVTYTVSFNEDMDGSTVTAADFGNAGTSTFTIGTITETSPGVFSVPVTPTSTGTLQLQLLASADVKDVAGNSLTAKPVNDDTTLTIIDTTPPTLASANIVDNKSGGPVSAGTLVTYTVTFSEDMDASTVTAADFGNAGSSTITIGTVSETSPGVFSVPVTPTTAGTLQLQLISGADVKDTAAISLVTTPVDDDTVITVDATPPTLASADIVDDRSGGPIASGIVVTYAVTFSEDMDASTVTAADFGNNGTASIALGTVTETSPGVFSVPVTPGIGTLRLQLLALADVKDVAGNSLASPPVDDDTELIVVEPIAYWDIDSTTPGSGGATPAGTWDASNSFWNGVADGSGTTATWALGQTAIFAAGSDASGTYSVTVDGTKDIGGLTFEEGTVTLTGGTALRLVANSTADVAAGLTATIGTPLTQDGSARSFTKSGAGTLVLSGASTYAGTTTLSGGTVNLTGSLSLGNVIVQASGTLNVPGTINGSSTSTALTYGTTAGLSTVNVSTGASINLFQLQGSNNASAVSVYNQTGGAVTVNTPLSTNESAYAANVGYGYMNLSGGSYTVNSRFTVALNGAGGGKGVTRVGGGAGSAALAAGDILAISRGAGAIGELTILSNGTVTYNATGLNNMLIHGNNASGTGYLNIVGGTLSSPSTVRSVAFGNGTSTNSSIGMLNLGSGTLELGKEIVTSTIASGGTNRGFINFSGGTVKLLATSTANLLLPATNGGFTSLANTVFGAVSNSTANLDGTGGASLLNGTIGTTQDFVGGVTFDTGIFNSTISGPLVAPTGGGLAQGNISITAAGSGYAGAPLVTFSNPAAANATPAAGYALVSGGQLTGIVITAPGSYDASDTVTVTLTGGGATVPATVANVSGASLTANTSGGLTKLGTGTLVLSNAANTFTGQVRIKGGILQSSGTGTLADIGANSALGKGDATNDATNAASLVLDGGTYSWVNTNAPVTTNRLFTLTENGGGLSADNGTAAYVITFGNTAPVAYTGSGARTLTLGGAHNGSANANTFSPLIANAGSDVVSLAKTGTTTWALTNINTYTGATTIGAGGTLQLGNGTTGNDGTIANTSGVTNDGTLAFNRFGSSTAAYNIIGTGGVSKLGAGTQILSGSNSYSGNNTIFDGLLQLGVDNGVSANSGLDIGSGSTVAATLDLNGFDQTLSKFVFTGTDVGGNLTITGGASSKLTVNTTTDTELGAGGTTIAANRPVTVDMSGLGEFAWDGAANTFRVGLRFGTSNASSTNPGTMTTTLADTNTIKALTLAVGTVAASNNGGTSILHLGQNNVLNADNVFVGTGSRTNATLDFRTGLTAPTVTIRGTDGSSRVAAFSVGLVQHTSTVTWTGLADFSAGEVDALVNSMKIGAANTGGSTNRAGIENATFTMGKGTLDVTDLIIGQYASGVGGTVAGSGTFAGNGIFNLNDSTGIVKAETIILADNIGTATGAATKIASGTFNLNAGTLETKSIDYGTQTGNANTVTRNVNFTGGTVRNITGFDLAIANVPINLTGSGTRYFEATAGQSITMAATSVISGSGQGFTKAGLGILTLSGSNTYTGNTVVSAGTLELATTGQLKFVLGATSGDSNGISGAGTATLKGSYLIDTSAADALASGSWTLENVTSTYDASFSVAGFTDVGSNKWEKANGLTKKYTFDEATGILTLASTASYTSWINGFFPGETLDSIIGAGADPDNDGISNGVEMVIGGDPKDSMDTALLPTIEMVNADPDNDTTFSDYLLFTYRRSDLSVTAGVTADCETDTDLVGTWTAATGAPGVVILTDDNFTFTPPAAANTDRVRVYVPRGANPTLFGRLDVKVP